MIDELRARFLPRFIDTARERLKRSLQLIGRADGAADLVTELHALAGEAAMLGLGEIAEAARSGETGAKAWLDGHAAAQATCARAVRGLNRQLESLASSGPPPDPAPDLAGDETRAYRVLIVDDSELASQHLAERLEPHGVTTRAAATFEGAMREAATFAPRLIVVDVNIPGVELGELCRELRAAAAGEIVIVLLSGLPLDQLAARAREVAADGYLSKRDGAGRIASRLLAILQEAES